MTVISALNNIHIKGSYGDYKDKNNNDLIKITEKKNLIIVQIVQYKTSSSKLVNLDGLSFNDKALNVSSNDETRILWTAPKSWILTSTKTNLEPGFLVERTRKNLLKDINKNFNNSDYAITDLSHSRAIIELEGKEVKEVLKKGSPFNFNELKKNNSLNTVFNGMAITVDMINSNPDKIRIFTLRSFGESLYHSITDACLEFGYECI
tara:strand:- start:64 stop:684 length:621 start_codon:yes stop_codon:yes gene_type:complete